MVDYTAIKRRGYFLKYENFPVCLTEKSDSGFIEIISNEPSAQDCYNILTTVVFNCKP